MKIHHSPGAGGVVAVCDQELLNTTLQHGDMEVIVSEKFYGSTPVTEEEVRAALKGATNINLMGDRAVGLAVELGLIGKDGYITIGAVPHAQIFRI